MSDAGFLVCLRVLANVLLQGEGVWCGVLR